jgi:glutathionylspermidine synthase
MQRLRIAPRPDWRARVEARGLDWHTAPDGSPYWDESVYWRFESAEIDRIEAATEELWTLCLAAIDHVIRDGRLGAFGYAPEIEALIAKSWAERDAEPTIYARFDLAYDGTDLKLLELNGDTPTSLVEAAVIQWWWLQDVFPEADQFNSIHEKLIDAFRLYAQGAARGAFAPGLHFSCVTPHAEDEGTIAYLGVCAAEGGLATGFIPLDQIGWREGEGNPGLFVDQDDRAIDTLFKLVPWEWLLADPFGGRLAAETLAGRIRVIEPAWKMLASHKRLLMVLAQLNPGHPLILEASDRVADARRWGEFARKPVHGREGQNVALMRSAMFGSQVIAGTGGHYGGDPVIYQRRARLAEADGAYAVLGSWVVDGQACGLGVREASGPITGDTARFVPHLFA